MCGTGLDSSQATITWTAPDGTTIMNNARYNLEDGSDIVRLNVTDAVMSDTGVWRCVVNTISENYIVSEGRLLRKSET